MKKRFGILLTAILLIITAVPTIQAQAADDIAISQTKATINIGDVIGLDITGTDAVPVWTSYKENIAKVNQNGEVTGLRKGSTTIKARVGNIYRTSTVKVVASSIKLNKKTATIYHGGTSTSSVKLKATVSGAGKDVTWESSNPEVAAVDSTGKVTSVSAGTATVTATANGKSASCVITVKESGIVLNMDSILVSTKGTGSSIKVTPSVTGSKKTVKWATSDKTIATVSGGKITGKKTGTATVTATANGVSASCEVAVYQGLISLNEEKVLLYAGGTAVETKQLKTNAGKNDVLTWTSSDPEVATVSAKGLVTALKAGTAVISVECNGTADTCEVTVKQTETNIIEDAVSLKTKGTDKTYTLNKEIIGKSSTVKWTTSDTKVATVSKGKITAKKAGTATITAKANGISDTVTVNVSAYDPTIKLNQGQYTLYTLKGNTLTLKATVDGPSKTATWESSNPSVGTVNNKGKVTAVSAGETVISASANGVTAQCTIEVKGSAVILDREYITIGKGEKVTIGVDVVGTSQTVTWATTNKKIATVSKGTVTAKDYGEADIKVTANGVTSICHIKVDNCDHAYEGVVTTEPTCGTNGVKTYTCTLCGDSYKETLPATGKHDYVQVSVKEADCVTEGFKEYKCSVCDDSYTEIIPATGEHSFEWAVVKEAGCVTEGLTAYRCTVCGHVEKEDVIAALGHDWGGWKITLAPTTTSTGLRIRTCNRCGEEETEEIPQLADDHEHDYKAIKVVEATCEEQGYTEYECSICYDSYTDYVEALGHEAGKWAVDENFAPDCTNGGWERKYCIRCDKWMEDHYLEPLGHDWGDWETVTEPTTTSAGLRVRTCSRCSEEEKEEIPQLVDDHEHEYKAVNVVEPTCTARGYTEYECSVCGDSYTDDYVDMLDHDYELVVYKEATCTETGNRLLECKNCKKTSMPDLDDFYIDALGHDWEINITKEPAEGVHESVDDFGSWTKTCQRCGEVRNQTVINIDIGDGQIKQIAGTFDDEEAYKTLELTNAVRAEKNLNALEWESRFEDLGKIRSVEIQYLTAHERPNGSGTVKYVNDNGFEIDLGENLAASFGHVLSAEDAMNLWINSEGHYANLVASCTTYYASCFIDDNGDSYWIQLFFGGNYYATTSSDATGRIIEISVSQGDADSDEADAEETVSYNDAEEPTDESFSDAPEQSDAGEGIEVSDDTDIPPDADDIFPLKE